jgi:hypothetical protein
VIARLSFHRSQVPSEFFEEFVSPLVGLKVSHLWQGYGTTIFAEFGRLAPQTRRGGTPGNPQGEFGLMVESTWRVEGRKSILCDSSSERDRWDRGCRFLIGQSVTSISCFGRFSDIDLALANGIHLVSFAVSGTGTAWALFNNSNSTLSMGRRGFALEVTRPKLNS